MINILYDWSRRSWLIPGLIILLTTLFFIVTGRGVLSPWKTAYTLTSAAADECFWNYDNALKTLTNARVTHLGSTIQMDIWKRDLNRRAGMSAFLAGRFETAIQHFDKLQTPEKPDYFISIYKGIALQKVSNFTDALTNFDIAADTAPHRQDAYLAKGHCYFQMNDLLSAYSEYIRALTIGEKLPFVYVDIGDAFRFYGDWDTARLLYQTASAVDIADPFTLLRLAEIQFYFNNDIPAATRLLNQITKIQPSWEPGYHLQEILESDTAPDPDRYLSTASFPDGPVKSWDLPHSKLLFELQREDWNGYN